MSDPLTRTRKISDLASRARCDLSAPPGNVAVKFKANNGKADSLNDTFFYSLEAVFVLSQIKRHWARYF